MKINGMTIITKCFTAKILGAINQPCKPKNNDDVMDKPESIISAEKAARTLPKASEENKYLLSPHHS